MDYLIGLDVGTTATKALLFTPDGRIAASATEPYKLITGSSGEVEQDPEAMWQAVVAALKKLSKSLRNGDHILAISQSSQGGTTIPVSEKMEPIGNAISWMDQRSHEEKALIDEHFGAEKLRMLTGWPLINGLPLQHIVWMRNKRADLFARTRFFLFVNDFIGYRLTGDLFMDPSNASITQLFNVEKKDWEETILEFAGISQSQLSPVSESGIVVGALTDEAARLTGLPSKTPVVNGAHDQYCSAVGLGVTEPGLVQLACGTAWVLLAVPESLEIGLASGMAISCHAASNRWGGLHSLGGIGVCMEWALDHLWENEKNTIGRQKALALMDEGIAAESPPGANGVLYLPVAGGHGEGYGLSPGGFFEMSVHSSRYDMARAVMETVAFELRSALEDFAKRGMRVKLMKATGGGANSRIWQQIVADVTQIPVEMPVSSQSASWGAAVLAAMGVGAEPTTGKTGMDGEERMLEPIHSDLYDDVYLKYRNLRELTARNKI